MSSPAEPSEPKVIVSLTEGHIAILRDFYEGFAGLDPKQAKAFIARAVSSIITRCQITDKEVVKQLPGVCR